MPSGLSWNVGVEERAVRKEVCGVSPSESHLRSVILVFQVLLNGVNVADEHFNHVELITKYLVSAC